MFEEGTVTLHHVQKRFQMFKRCTETMLSLDVTNDNGNDFNSM